MSTPHITELRQQLLATLSDLRSRDTPMDPDRARAIAQVAGVLVDSAKVEVEYVKATGQDHAEFLKAARITTDAGVTSLPNGINSITRHRLQG